MQDMMKELKLEIEARERVGESSRGKVNGTSRETRVAAADKIVCPYFPNRCNFVTNTVTRTMVLHCRSRCFACTRKSHHTKDCN